MQVNNNVQSPNFGMASYFSKNGAKVFVEAASDKLNKKVAQTAEKVKGTKTWNIEFTTDGEGKELLPRVVSPYADKFLPPYKAQMPHDEFLTIRVKYDGTDLGEDFIPGNTNFPVNLKYLNAEEAKAAYKRVIEDDFDAAAEIATKLEESHIERETQKSAETAARLAAKNQAQSLVMKLGIGVNDSAGYKKI